MGTVVCWEALKITLVILVGQNLVEGRLVGGGL